MPAISTAIDLKKRLISLSWPALVNPNRTLDSCLALIATLFIEEIPRDERESRIAMEMTLTSKGFDLLYSCTYAHCTDLYAGDSKQLSLFSNISARNVPVSYFMVSDRKFLSLKIATEHFSMFGSATHEYGDQVCELQISESFGKYVEQEVPRSIIAWWADGSEDPTEDISQGADRSPLSAVLLAEIERGLKHISSKAESRNFTSFS